MLKPLNIDLPQSAWVWELNKSASAYTCEQLQPAGAVMLFSTDWRASLAVTECRAKSVLGCRAQTVRVGLMQTDRPRCRPLMSPLVLTWKRRCSPKAGFSPHIAAHDSRGKLREKNKWKWRVDRGHKSEETGDETGEQRGRGKRVWWELHSHSAKINGYKDKARKNESFPWETRHWLFSTGKHYDTLPHPVHIIKIENK